MRRTAVVWLLALVVSCGTTDDNNNPIFIIGNNDTPANTGPNNTSANNTTANNTPANNGPANNTPANNTPINSTPGAGRFSLLEVGFDTPAAAYTPDGVAHIVYTAGADPGRVMYGRCAADCGAAQSWTWVTLASGYLVNDSRFTADAQGGLHVVYQTEELGADEQTYYATCAGSCTAAGSWSTVDLTPALGGTGFVYRGSPLIVSPEGAVYLLTSDFTNNGRIILTQCLQNCADGRNWTSGVIRTGGYRSALAVSGTRLHHVVANESGFTGTDGLVYRTCASNCTDAAAWQESTPMFAYDANGTVTLAAVGGEVRLAYNQGNSTDPTPAVQAQNTRLLYWTCSSGCTDAASWSGVTLANPGDGEDLSMTAVGPATVLTYASDALEMVLAVCEGGCLDPASWQLVALDSTAQMNADHDPYAFLCGGSRPYFASLYPERPSLAVSPVTGSGLLVHAGALLQQCSVGAMSAKTDVLGRVVFLP